MKKYILLFFLALSFSMSAQTLMTRAEIKDFVYNIIIENQKIKTMQTDFVQVKKMDFLDKAITTSGTMSMQSPNLLSWEYTKPYQYKIIFKNSKIYINDQGKKSTANVKNKMFEKINQMITGSANGQIFIDKDFSITYYKDRQKTITKFVPKNSDMKKYIQQIDLHFQNGKATVSEVVMHEASGDITTITFKNTQLNVPLSAAVFNP